MPRLLVALCMVLILSAPLGCGTEVTSYEEVVNGIANVVVHYDDSENVIFKELPAEVKNLGLDIGVGFTRPEDLDIYPFDRPQTLEFRLKEDEDFTPLLTVGNGLPEPQTVLISILLDYRQVSFVLDGKAGLLHQVTIPSDRDMYIPFYLDIDGTGAHDLQVVVFDDPYNFTLDKNYRMSLEGHVTSRRAVVIIGFDETPARLLQPVTLMMSPIPSDVSFSPPVGFVSAPSSEEVHPSKRQLYVAEAAAGKPYSFQMYLANAGYRPVIQAMVSFLDYHQFKINGLDLLLADLRPGEETVVDITLQMASEPAIHQFQTIYLFDPYKSLLRKEVFLPVVFFSHRIAINTN